jgi:uncharacterized protein (UPF0335 family)
MSDRRHFLYIATPYSKFAAGTEEAFKMACRVAGSLIDSGVAVFSPIAHSHPIAEHAQLDPLSHKIWLPAAEPMMHAAVGADRGLRERLERVDRRPRGDCGFRTREQTRDLHTARSYRAGSDRPDAAVVPRREIDGTGGQGMTETLGNNSQAMLRGFVDRIENVNKQIDDLRDDKKVITAEAKAAGFEPKYIGKIVRKRRKKPHDWQEEDAKESMYMHAVGMAPEPPLFRTLNALAKDATSRATIIETFKKIVPPKGEFIVKIGGKPVRIFRDSEGNAQSEPWEESGSSAAPDRGSAPMPPKQKAEVPDCDDEGAKALGTAYAKDNRPVTDNPFPYGDKRRALFDEAWRTETGSDGMGKDD